MALLTVEQLRSLIPGEITLEDDALQLLLDGAEAVIDEILGAIEETTEVRDGGFTYLFLRRRASAITSITENDGSTDTTLAADDWTLGGDGRSLRRRSDGTHPATFWDRLVTVVYDPEDDSAKRKLVQAELVKLEIASNPGLASTTVGSWTEQYAQGQSYDQIRRDILASLTPAWQFA